MLNANYENKFVKEGLTFDDVLMIPASPTCCPKSSSHDDTSRDIRF
jgi:IMP dehydrogenase/GMP reductase